MVKRENEKFDKRKKELEDINDNNLYHFVYPGYQTGKPHFYTWKKNNQENQEGKNRIIADQSRQNMGFTSKKLASKQRGTRI